MTHPAAEIIEESLLIDHRDTQLPAVLAFPIEGTPLGAALIAGPHPLMGGGLENNVVMAVARGLAEHGYVSLRFGYGGGGTSRESMQEFWRTGCAPEDPARIEDARAAWRQLMQICTGPTVHVGYSFGAAALAGLQPDSHATHIVLIGPTLKQHSFDGVQHSSIPKLIMTADNDFATPLEITKSWFERAQEPKKLVVIESAEHFYRGLEDRLTAEILEWL